MSSSGTAYTQGHSAAVVASHLSRTVQNSAAFLVPHIQPHFTILDLGCGPGTITRGFCALVPQGRVTGIDAAEKVIEQARSLTPGTETEYKNLTFQVGDITNGLSFADDSVDVVYTHQTLCHIPDPVIVIKEAHRVLKPGGMLAMREFDGMSWYPSSEGLERFNALTAASVKPTGAQGFESGRRLHVWAKAAGFERTKMSIGAGAMCYTAPDEAKWWADVHVGRLSGEIGEKWLKWGILRNQEELESLKAAMRAWGNSEDAWFAGWQGEVICWK
ncbi:uncharacterized protein Z518_02398 [Rhinocladiella mackenziei CBS 650.93]|uniref:Rhinocladiella mackenziei CBS 650.93 unplaced genomic scaffold supercont1.2, whole genome shotgun sequence n=1 Tax=Rhinocladiella mackenziei CBS 650.93 TaxID=1442369 RepID=A0A0D2IPE2_9EURO|nr:uncharacterized protein Z518_02398 [Rhinocladiella mackenziei CBS 650.93]KIX07744.1 hypothetical protein Z518_02398 [Rhinocladiella mackenziei CBS 650.93]